MTLAFNSVADFISMNGYKYADRLWLGVTLAVVVIVLMIVVTVIQQRKARLKVYKRWRSLEENCAPFKEGESL